MSTKLLDYPLNKARIGVKFGQNAFRTIPDISCFDVKQFFAIFKRKKTFFFQESRVLEELGIFERHWQIPRRTQLPPVR